MEIKWFDGSYINLKDYNGRKNSIGNVLNAS